jgi:hypothetical protein
MSCAMPTPGISNSFSPELWNPDPPTANAPPPESERPYKNDPAPVCRVPASADTCRPSMLAPRRVTTFTTANTAFVP